jgi:general stress protein YciG
VTSKYSKRGFASMTKEQRCAIASKGGVRAHQLGTAHQWSRDEAIENGRKGGHISRGGRGKVKAQ